MYKVGDKLLHISEPNDKRVLTITRKFIAEEDKDSFGPAYAYELDNQFDVSQCWLNARCVKLSKLGEILYG